MLRLNKVLSGTAMSSGSTSACVLSLLAVAAVSVGVNGQTPTAPRGDRHTQRIAEIALASTSTGPASASAEPTAAGTRLREGTQLTDRMGYFRQNGDALTFVDEEGRELGGLPNLSLERIIRMLKSVDEPESVKWSVSGTVTEFSGRNYLLVHRAVYKAALLPPIPDAVP